MTARQTFYKVKEKSDIGKKMRSEKWNLRYASIMSVVSSFIFKDEFVLPA